MKTKMRTGAVALVFALASAVALTGCAPVYLDSLTRVSATGGGQLQKGSVNVNGKTYQRSLFANPEAMTRYVEYDLGRKYKTLETTIGLRDDADSRLRSTWRIYGDGRLLSSGQSRLGMQTAVKANVTNVLRLRIEYEIVVGYNHPGYLVFGTAILRA